MVFLNTCGVAEGEGEDKKITPKFWTLKEVATLI